METHLDSSKTLALVGKKFIYIYNNYGLMKIRANFENIKVQYFEMFEVFKYEFFISKNLTYLIIPNQLDWNSMSTS